MFQRFFSRNNTQALIRRLYGAVVAQGRKPAFYAEYGVPDTLEGRFDMVLLHVYLVWRRLANEEGAPREAAQQMFDLFVQDMDESMRELGVGDLSVPKKVRAMGEAFYGRSGSYDRALADPEDEKLAAALARNVFGGSESLTGEAARLAHYVRAADRGLAAQPAQAIALGDAKFPEPEEINR